MLKKAYFRKVTGKKGSKSFWNAIKSFFTNRGTITNDSIALEENGVLKNGPKETALLESDPLQSAISISNVKIELP